MIKKKMWGVLKKSLFLLLTVAVAAPAHAGKLDLDYRSPEPVMVLASAIIVPGGGWFYKSGGDQDRNFLIGVGALAATIGAILFGSNGARKNDGTQAAFGYGCAIFFHTADIYFSVNSTVKRRRAK